MGITYWVGHRSLQASAALARHEAFTKSLLASFSTLQDAETGQRGYLLSREEAYLAPFQAASKEAMVRLADLQQFVRSGDIDRKLLDRLTEAAQAKMLELQSTVDLAQSGQQEEAVNILRRGSGKAFMDEIRTLIGTSLESEREQRAQTKRFLKQAITFRYVTYAMVLVGNLLFLLWAYHRIEHEREQRRLAETEASRQRDLLGGYAYFNRRRRHRR